MLRRVAAVFAAMIAMGFPGIPSAEARPDMVGYQGDYAPGTIVVKTNERRLYLIIDSGSRAPVSRWRRQSRQAMDGHRAHRGQVSRPRLGAAGRM